MVFIVRNTIQNHHLYFKPSFLGSVPFYILLATTSEPSISVLLRYKGHFTLKNEILIVTPH